MNRIHALTLIIGVWLLVPTLAFAGDDCLVGAYYFAGWWESQPNKYITGGKDWREDFPGRVPLLGMYNDQSTMDKEIDAAAQYGIDFFQILWYPVEDLRRRRGVEGKAMPPHIEKTNDGLRLFLASSKNQKMRFTIEYVNHAPFGIVDNRAWEKTCRLWADVMRHPRYLRLGGRPVLKIHGLHALRLQCNEDDALVAGRVTTLRTVAQQQGLPDPLIGAGVSPLGIPSATVLQPFDFVTTYMEIPRLEKRDDLYPYEELLALAEKGWIDYAKHCSKPYIPYVPAGWDPRPWQDPRPSFELPTQRQWRTALQSVVDAVNSNENLGLPISSGRQKVVLIYAWNEFAEGGIVAPTRGDEYMKLEAIKDVLGTGGDQ